MSVSNILLNSGPQKGKIDPQFIVGGGAGVVDSVNGSSSIFVSNDPVNPVVSVAFAQAEDLMVGTGLNAGAVLGKGANGTYLGVNNAGVLSYSNPPTQGVNFTAQGQMLYSGAPPGFADTLLPIGGPNQVLGVGAGVPAWQDEMGGSRPHNGRTGPENYNTRHYYHRRSSDAEPAITINRYSVNY